MFMRNQSLNHADTRRRFLHKHVNEIIDGNFFIFLIIHTQKIARGTSPSTVFHFSLYHYELIHSYFNEII